MHRIKYKLVLIPVLFMILAQVSCARRSPNVYPLDRAYYNEAKLSGDLDSLSQNHPDLISRRILGYTATGKDPIYALNIQTGKNRIPVLLIGQHHGDEVMGVEIVMAFAHKLANYKNDPTAKELLDTYSFWIIPTLNPEGWKVVTTGKFEWKRKNNTDTNNNKKLNLKTDGVDLNRNYPLFWELEKTYPVKHLYYKGKAPGSEAEVQAILRLADQVRFRYAFSYHTSVTGNFGETLYLPWTDKQNAAVQARADSLRRLARVYADYAPRDYSPGNYRVHTGYTSKIGNFRNYFFYTYGTLALDIETCGINKYGQSIVHPAAAQRDIIVKKNVRALATTLLFAQ